MDDVATISQQHDYWHGANAEAADLEYSVDDLDEVDDVVGAVQEEAGGHAVKPVQQTEPYEGSRELDDAKP